MQRYRNQCGCFSILNWNDSALFCVQVPNFKNATLPASEQVTAQEIELYFRQELIYKRNERMGRRVRALLEEQPDKSFFFAFGAGQSPRTLPDPAPLKSLRLLFPAGLVECERPEAGHGIKQFLTSVCTYTPVFDSKLQCKHCC